jgi:hypothetical protein
MVCIYWAKRRRTKANIIPFAGAGKTVVIVDDDEPLVHIEIPHPLCNEQATPPGGVPAILPPVHLPRKRCSTTSQVRTGMSVLTSPSR